MEQLTATVKQNAITRIMPANWRRRLLLKPAMAADGFRCSKNDGRYLHEFEEISEITSVINSIAFQTNILALMLPLKPRERVSKGVDLPLSPRSTDTRKPQRSGGERD